MYLSTNQMAACLVASTLVGSSILIHGYVMGWIVLAIILTMSNHIVNNRSEAIGALEKDLHMQDLKARVVAQKAIIEQLKLDNLELEQEVACRTETNERLQNRNIILEDEVEVLDSLVLEEREEALFAESFSTAAIRQRNEARREVAVQKTEIAELRGELQSTLRNLDGQTSMALCFLDTAGELEQELADVKAQLAAQSLQAEVEVLKGLLAEVTTSRSIVLDQCDVLAERNVILEDQWVVLDALVQEQCDQIDNLTGLAGRFASSNQSVRAVNLIAHYLDIRPVGGVKGRTKTVVIKEIRAKASTQQA